MLNEDDWGQIFLPEVRFTFEHYAQVTHQGSWADVAAKAKRLVQQGKVTILRNAPHHVMAQVIGDGSDNGGTPDMHEVEISRHDPNSQIIEQWNCSCAWAQFAFDRTRKWKKLEGRVCSHVLATYWKAKGTPMDMQDQTDQDTLPGQKGIPGQQQLQIPTDMPFAPAKPDVSEEAPPTDEEGEAPVLADGTTIPPVTPALPQTPPGQLPSTLDLTVPKQRGVSPYSPEKVPQHEQLHLFDITMPPGMQPNPQAPPVSIPGGRPPSPGSPVQFPGTFSRFIPVIPVYGSLDFVYASDPMSDFFETNRAANRPIYVALTNLVALEASGGKIPVPGARPYDVSKENVPLWRVADLGWNPDTQRRENADVNALAGAPEHTGQYIDATPGQRGEVIDFDTALKMAYVNIPLNYPGGEDVRLHPHSLKGWVDFKDLKVLPQGANPARKR